MIKVRKREIDIAKGIGILLVVLCHVMSPVMENNKAMINVYRFVYTFICRFSFF